MSGRTPAIKWMYDDSKPWGEMARMAVAVVVGVVGITLVLAGCWLVFSVFSSLLNTRFNQ